MAAIQLIAVSTIIISDKVTKESLAITLWNWAIYESTPKIR